MTRFSNPNKAKNMLTSGWGVLNTTTGEWRGMISNIVKEEIDMTVCALSYTLERALAVQFLPPIDDTMSFGAYIKRMDSNKIEWSIFIKPFETSTWIYFIVYAVVFSIFIVLIFQLTKPTEPLGIIRKCIMAFFLMVKGTFLVFSSVFGNAPLTKKTVNQGSKIIIFTICFVGNLSFLIYQASLTSYLITSNTPQLPFTSMKGLVESDYK